MDDEGVDPVGLPESGAERLGGGDGAVLAARAADGDSDIAAALADVALDHRLEQVGGPVEELLGAGLLP